MNMIRFKHCYLKDTTDGIKAFWYQLDSKGKKIQKRKRFKSINDGKVFCEDLDKRLDENGKLDCLSLSKEDELAIRFFYSEERTMSLHQFIHSFTNQITHPFRSKTVEEVVKSWIDYKISKGKLNSDSKKRISVFETYFKGKVIGNISKHQINRWLANLKLAPKTVKHYRGTVVEMLRWADLEDMTQGIEQIHILEQEKAIYAIDEIIKILIHFRENHEELFPSVVIMMYTGVRVSEILKLKWEDFDLSNLKDDEFYINSNKSGRRLAFIPSICKQWLLTCCNRTGPIFQAYNVKRPLSKLSKAITKSMPSDVSKKYNAFRHTSATMKFSLNKNASDIAGELGNSVHMLRKHYVRPALRKEAKLFWQLTPSYIELLRMAENPSIESKQFYNYKDSKLVPPSEKLAKSAINEALSNLIKKTDNASIENKLDLILKKLEL